MSSLMYLIVMAIVFLKIKRISRFYVFFLATEYFYILGLGVYPLLLSVGVFDIHYDYGAYSNILDVSFLTPIHIIFCGIGAFLGAYSISLSGYFSSRFVQIAKLLYLSPLFILSCLCFFVFIPFFLLVIKFGFAELITSASLRRSGAFDFSEGLGGLSFFIKFITLGLFMVVVYPYYLLEGRNLFKVSFLIVTVGLIVYMVTASRFALFQSFVLLFLLYWSYNFRRFGVNFLAIFMTFLVLFILIYGKVFVSAVGAYISEGEWIELTYSFDFSSLMMHFGHLFYSIDAGVRNFSIAGPYIAKDILLSPLGVLPSGVFEKFGLSDFSYQFLDKESRSACVNTSNLGVEGQCYVPPYYTGISAYAFPVLGGFVFAYFRFLMYFSIARAWARLEFKSEGFKYIPLLLIFFFFIEQLMLFIPNSISLMIFFALITLVSRFFISTLRA